MSSTGSVINLQPRPVPGLAVQNFLDNGGLTLKIPDDGRLRKTTWIRGLCFHTTKGLWPQTVIAGYGPHVDDAAKVNRYWSNSEKHAGAQFVGDRDGQVASLCDCWRIAAFHAGDVNEVTEGYEIYQEEDHDLYEGQLQSAVTWADAHSWFFGIQRQVQEVYVGPITRLNETHAGLDVVGCYGHRDVTSNRGRGDPGDHIYDYLMTAGYEKVNYQTSTDLALWKPRQTELNKKGAKLKVDGVAGPATTAAVKKYYATDKPRGLWIPRPIDDLLASAYGINFNPASAGMTVSDVATAVTDASAERKFRVTVTADLTVGDLWPGGAELPKHVTALVVKNRLHEDSNGVLDDLIFGHDTAVSVQEIE